MVAHKLERELKRGSAELLILALLEERQRHGYEIGQLIASRSGGAISFHVTSLYPTLYRLEDRGLIEGRWVERAGQRRRRYYKLTRMGRRTLVNQRGVWDTFFVALNRVANAARGRHICIRAGRRMRDRRGRTARDTANPRMGRRSGAPPPPEA